MGNQTLKKQLEILEHSIAASAGAYYNINLSQNIVPGIMYQVIDKKEYNLNEKMGLSEDACFTDVVEYWGSRLPENERDAYFSFLDISNLIQRFLKGEEHVSHRYWTQSALFEEMLAEQHIIMYEDEENGDILAVTYVCDLTLEFKKEEYKKKLEEKQKALESNLEELNKEKNILDALSIDYTSVYYCDLMKDTLLTLKQGKNTNGSIIEREMTANPNIYSLRMKYFYDHFVIKESAPDFEYKLSAEYLMKYLRDNQRLAYRFRTHPNQSGQQFFEVQFVHLNDDDGFKVIMGYRYIDDILVEQEKQKMQLEHALAEATLNSEIIDSISKLYWLIYRMDLTKGTYEEISSGQEMHRLTGKQGKTREVFREVRETFVAPEHQKMMREFLDTSTLPERLKDTESVAIEYHAASGSWHQGRFIVKRRNRSGEVTNVLYVVRQIDTEKKKEVEYKQKLVKAAEDARRANMVKTDFLRRMSHDIRTPINGIQGMIAIADRYPNDIAKLAECRSKVKEAAGFLGELVNSILDMNKLESGAIMLEHKPFDLFEVLMEVNSISEMNGEIRELNLSFDHADISHSHLVGSPIHLKQILQNIAGNAAKYNKIGGAIQFSTKEIGFEDGKAIYQFICKDTGLGMSKEFIKHAFEPFAQEKIDARTSYMGTGLGLPIAKELVELMGGSIELESELNVGTTFIITIPFEVDFDYKESENIELEADDDLLTGVKVLLVEDNELNMEIAEFILEEAGMNVITARNGKEGVDIFTESIPGTFDIILMDIMMPVMDGLTASRTIRKMSRIDAKEIPIFAMTANAFLEDKERSKEAGINEHLSKPLDERKIIKMIKKYMSHKKIRQ